MAERKVQLVIEVDDTDVKQATTSLNRLEIAAKQVQRTDVDGRGRPLDNRSQSQIAEQQRRAAAFMANDMPTAAAKAADATQEVAAGAAAAGGQVAGMGARVGAAIPIIGAFVIAAAAIVIVTVKVAQQIFKVAESFAKYVIEASKASEATSLATTTVAGLNHELEAQGRSVSELNAPIANFQKLIGQATAGNEDARQKLKLLGVDGSKAILDVESAFKTAVANIVKAPTAMQQATLAFSAFGDEGYKILPFLKEFGGNVDAAVAKARELGIEIGGRDVKASKEFNRAWEDTKKVVLGIAYAFGREFLPGVTSALKGVSGWILSNKETIKSWAQSTGDWITWLVDRWQILIGVVNNVAQVMSMVTRMPLPVVQTGYGTPAALPQNYDPALNPKMPNLGDPDPAALQALREEAKRLADEREKAAKAELAAQIQLYENSAQQLATAYDDAFRKITEQFKDTLNVSQYEANWQQLKEWYGENINSLVPKWEELVKQQTLSSGKGTSEMLLIKTKFDEQVRDMTDRTLKNQEASEKAIADVRKKLTADQIKDYEVAMNRRIEIDESSTQTRIAQIEFDARTMVISERQKVDAINALELNGLEKRKTEAKNYLAEVVGFKEKEAEASQRIKLLDDQIAQQKITNANRVLDVEEKLRKKKEELIKAYEDYKLSLEDQIQMSLRGNQPLSIYEQTMRDLQRDYKDLEPAQKQHLLDLAAQADAVEALNKQHAELKGFFSETLNYAFEGDFKGLIKSFADRAKESMIDRLSSVLATSVLGFDPNATNNPVAKPIVGRLDTTNSLLAQLVRATGQTPAIGSMGKTTGIGSVISNIFGGGGSGMGPGGTPWFNPSAGGSNPFFAQGQSAAASAIGMANGGGSGSGGGFGGILSGLGGGLGGLFKGRKNLLTGKVSGMAGTLGGIGDIASMAGGMIGGRWGNLISMAGMGASIGANFGPWGAAIGAGIGGVAGLVMALFGGDNANKKIKEAALSQYGITIKDKSVLNSLKQLGEQYFGKGKVGANAVQLVQTDEAKNILRNYAEATGQSGAKIDILSHGDENWSGNQFRGRFGGFRAMGGSVRAGYDYIVGERGPEMIRMHRDATVIPAQQTAAMMNGQNFGSDRIVQVIGQLEETVHMLATRLETVSAGEMLRMGVQENPRAVRDGYERELHADPRSTRSLNELTGSII